MAERPIGFWLKLVDRLIDERFAAIIEEHGVTRRQWQLLVAISKGPTSVTELDAAIAPFLQAGAGETSAEHLAELVESDWVAIAGETYELTERGTVAFTKLSEVVDRLRSSVSQGLSSDEYRMTLASLERMARNLGYTD